MNQMPYYRTLVVLNGAVPAAMLAWDAYRGQLGANTVNNALHITGILSLVFLFLSLLMTPLRWATGWGGWIAFRRALGLYGFFYAVVHLIIYVAFDRALSLSGALHEVWTRRFLQVGAVAILLMIPLAVTSTNTMIRRLGAKRWKLIHRAAYLAAALGVLHYYMLVKSDVRQPLAFAGVLALLLGGRFARHYRELLRTSRKDRPDMPGGRTPVVANVGSTSSSKPRLPWKGDLKIVAIFRETPDVKTLRLASPDGGAFPFEYLPGQFLNIQLTIDGKRVNRSYTIASSPTRSGACELTIKREPLGLVSQFVHDQLKVGDVVKVSGPFGKFTFAGNEAPGVVLIAGGVGITPVMSILRHLTDRAWPGDIFFLVVAKTEQDLIFHEELEWLRHRFSRFQMCVTLTRAEPGSAWSGERGRPTEALLRRFVPDLNRLPVFLCGPNEMMDATQKLLVGMNVSASQIYTEAFAARKGSPSDVAVVPAPTNGHAVGMGAESDSAVRSTSLPSATDKTHIHFSRSDVRTEAEPDTTVLEAAERASVELPYECRSGICGQCKTKLVKGRVRMDSEDALSPSEKAAGLILSCQARPLSDVVIEA